MTVRKYFFFLVQSAGTILDLDPCIYIYIGLQAKVPDEGAAFSWLDYFGHFRKLHSLLSGCIFSFVFLPFFSSLILQRNKRLCMFCEESS